MAKEITTSIVIRATAEKVWSVLTDFESYPNWNPFITSVSGKAEEGNTIRVKIEPPQAKAMVFKPTILSKVENKELRWLGKLFIKGLFDGEHVFELSENGDGTTTFVQREKFSGILVSMVDLENTKKGFEEMNKQLKEIAER